MLEIWSSLQITNYLTYYNQPVLYICLLYYTKRGANSTHFRESEVMQINMKNLYKIFNVHLLLTLVLKRKK